MNEDGALFCEQCKSDLSAVPMDDPGAGMAMPAAPETMPMAALVGDGGMPMMAMPLGDAPPMMADPMMDAPPMMAAPMDLAPPPAAAPPAPAPSGAKLPADAKPRLVVLRGLKINVEYPVYEGQNYIGRADEKPVDIDLDDQEPPDRVWSSRQHALIMYENGELILEDLNSANGTFVNRTRVYPGQKRALQPNDVVQVGTVQMKLKV